MAKKKGTGIPGLSFSWKRATGVTKAKQNFARQVGIPTTKAGRQQKAGKAMGCATVIIGAFAIVSLLAYLL